MLYELPLAAVATLSGLAVMVRDLDALLRAPDHVPGAAFALGQVLIGLGIFVAGRVVADARSRVIRVVLLARVAAVALVSLALGVSASARATGVWCAVLAACGCAPLVACGLAARPWFRPVR